MAPMVLLLKEKKVISDKTIKIAYLMHGLKNVGGGEHSISYLIKGLNKNEFKPLVIYSFKNRIIEKLIQDNVPTIQVRIDHEIASVYRDQITINPFKIIKYFLYQF